VSTRKVIRGGLWLYARSLANNITGYAYWFLVSRIAGAEALGLSSATVSLATLISGILALGVPTALQRFLGMALGRKDQESLREYFWSAAAFTIATRLSVGLSLILAGLSGLSLLSLDPGMLKYAGALVCLSWIIVLDSLLISHLRTRASAIAYTAGSLAKLAVGLPLVWIGWGWSGVVVGYLASYVITGLSLLAFSAELGVSLPKISLRALMELLRAGLSVWTPGVITLVGQQVGVLAVFGIRGGLETGTYYAAFSIAGAVWAFPMLVLSLLIPVLSGMEDGKKRATWKTLKLATALSAALSALLLAYPRLLLGLLGGEFTAAEGTLMVLALSAVPTTIIAGVNSLAFSYGRYRLTLEIGIAQSAPRLALYLLLTPLLGGLGAAVAFTAGSLVGLIATLLACRSLGFELGRRALGGAFLTPFSIAVAFHYAGVPWPVGVPALALLTVILYIRTAILTRDDLRDLALAVVPVERVPAVASMLRWLDRLLYGGDQA